MLNSPRWDLYNPGDVVGKSGVELEYNSMLMGKNGSRRVIVNSRGKEMGQLDEEATTRPVRPEIGPSTLTVIHERSIRPIRMARLSLWIRAEVLTG